MAEQTLYDYLGRPIRRQDLSRELAAPALTGMRTVWDTTIAGGLTPARLGAILHDAALGDADAYLTLAEEIEERDPHYACELAKRKLAVSRLPLTVESFSDDAPDLKLADAVRNLVRRPGIRSLIKDLLDGLAKGYSVCEIIWDRSKTPWLPARLEWRDPRWFMVDRISRRQIRLKDEANPMEGIELAPYKFISHLPHLKTGLPIRGGIARVAAWAWICKSYTLKDWMAFAEVFGMPLRVGKYRPGTLDSDLAILKLAVANLGSDAAAVIPESMMIELIERKGGTGGESLFKALAEYLDAQVSKLILGQTATTQGTPGKLGNEEAQNEVRHDIRDDDADQLAETLNRDLVRPFIDLNFGPQENYPSVLIQAPDQEDITLLTTALKELVPLGLKVEQSVVRDRLGLPDPDPQATPEDLLGVPANNQPAARERGQIANLSPDKDTAAAQNREQHGQEFTPEQQALERLADTAVARAQDTLRANEERLQAIIQGADSYEEACAQLLDAWPDLTMDGMTELLAQAIVAAGMYGRKTVEDMSGPA